MADGCRGTSSSPAVLRKSYGLGAKPLPLCFANSDLFLSLSFFSTHLSVCATGMEIA